MLGVLFSGIQAVLSVVAQLVPSIIKIVGAKLETFAKALEAFFKALGLIETNEQVEQIGDKALQAESDEVSPLKVEDFDSHKKYLEALKEREIDPEKSALIPQDDKYHKGIEILLGMAIERYGEAMSNFSKIIVENPDIYNNSGRLIELGNIARNDKDSFDGIVNYLDGESTNTEKNDAAFDKLVDIEKSINPEATEAEIWKAVSDMKR